MTRGPRPRSRLLAAVLATAAVLLALLAVPASAAAAGTATIYYRAASAWSSVNIHYALTGGAWTTVPGVPMTAACPGWYARTIDLGTATGLTAAFNNGGGIWDNNGAADYAIGSGVTVVSDSEATANAPDPCASAEPDTAAPTAPRDLTATVNATTVILGWTASTDDVGVAGYRLTRTSAEGTVTRTTTATQFADANLDPETEYTYAVTAYDAVGNVSAASASVAATTGEAPPTSAGGEMLGGDPRQDPIYFAMTARFYDGDESNNRGGAKHETSGNAEYDDPMFRGDFSGLIERLDYIKGLGFSAVWITPVVLNRSDYDYHGYHGYDFYEIDARLESEGASYQDLIDTAHAKGMKIYQDVVLNHSSRWGAVGLETPKVYGVQDAQWGDFYDTPNPGFTYDGLAVEPNSGRSHYNGDLWSTSEPAGNTCRNWGRFTGNYSAEGWKVYHCQWPSPTSGMFSAEHFHQCWIGNWEGEDARSCWIHEDLADFNTENEAVQEYLIGAYEQYIDMGVDGFRVDTAVHIPRVTWNRVFLPALQEHLVAKYGEEKAQDFYIFGEVAAFVHDRWNRGSVNHSAQFYTWQERREYAADDVAAALEQYDWENAQGTENQPTSDNAFLDGNAYHEPDHSRFSGMNIIDMRMHMNFGEAGNAFYNGKDSDAWVNDATYNAVYVDSHDYGPNKSSTRYAGGTDAWAENMNLMWTFRGIPTLYYGSEVEFQAGVKIDCGPTCPLAETGRAYYGDNLEGTLEVSDFSQVESATGAIATTMEQPLVQHLQRLNEIRRAVPALTMGQYSTEGISGGIAFKRRYTDATTDSFALVAITSSATFTSIPNGTYTDAVTGEVRTVTNGTLTATVSGKGDMAVWVLDTALTDAPGQIGADGPYLS
ncbi:alpha-amylase family glycosyl hydrolase [Glycomyces algeriensis]|uniref:Alpha-amylase n=1 Tax=Glycomyces algeriensis TaxID=256037 RepID=A0A9W6GBZ5_9ACTN|nr:alpha-amylase family glycosyl hydrolase [Glycomyces algeriensis]MDA1365609.1 alpha-amylase family glycosyl hydrolase [Glycomyces algeriensis]MDR7351297.1 glycosidase [Glycomyces algeriensis]GLI44012.1 alpha-amylase [Glycomyces algeriensis]